MTEAPVPVAHAERVESLDVLRGFALLGILLLNIIGFGLISTAYSNPPTGFTHPADPSIWATMDMFAEGAMRGLFSLLFGAGVVMFTTGAGAKSRRLHYRRQAWLLGFGLVDAYVLLWSGDILITYALAGAALYWVRNVSATRLFICAALLVILMSAMHGITQFGLRISQQVHAEVALVEDRSSLSVQQLEAAAGWEDFAADFLLSDNSVDEELAARRGSYASAFLWNVGRVNELLMVILPLFLFWDALAMMLLGMALYKTGILLGNKSRLFYLRMTIAAMLTGIAVNSYEVSRAYAAGFDLLNVFSQAQVSYHLGRIAMSIGYLSFILWLLQTNMMMTARLRLAAVGQLALTNYLLQSILCLFIFTGAGFGLVGELHRWALYPIVISIWVFQLMISPWWLARFRFGPAEWLWRGLTYGQWPQLRHLH